MMAKIKEYRSYDCLFQLFCKAYGLSAGDSYEPVVYVVWADEMIRMARENIPCTVCDNIFSDEISWIEYYVSNHAVP